MKASAFFSSSQIKARFTLLGWGTGYGDLRIADLFIPAFGPHAIPLHDPKKFGIAQKIVFDHVDPIKSENFSNSIFSEINPKRTNNENHENSQNPITLSGWSCCYGDRTTWICFNALAEEKGVRLSVQAIGSDLLKFVFYIQAKKCLIENGPVLFPGELKKYEGLSPKIILNERIFLQCKEKNKIQVIPLSGTECFWNSTFLIAIDFVKERSLFNIINLEMSLKDSI